MPKSTFASIKENGTAISLALLILSILSIFNGFLLSDIFIGCGTDYFSNMIFTSVNHFSSLSGEFTSASQKNIPFILSLGGIFSSLFLFFNSSNFLLNIKENKFFYNLHQFLYFRWFFDLLQNKFSLMVFN